MLRGNETLWIITSNFTAVLAQITGLPTALPVDGSSFACRKSRLREAVRCTEAEQHVLLEIISRASLIGRNNTWCWLSIAKIDHGIDGAVCLIGRSCPLQ